MSVEPGKWGVIYNPKAGTRKVQKRWKEIKEYMDSKGVDRKSTRLNSSHNRESRMPSSA